MFVGTGKPRKPKERAEGRRLRQELGRLRAHAGESLHMAGCMLYWAEGAKDRNTLALANSDIQLMRFFIRFLRECFDVQDRRIAMRLNVYLGNGLALSRIEDCWLNALELPRSCLGVHTVNHFPTSSSGRKRNKLPHGVCAIRVRRSTHLIQHIFGAIQEYTGLDQPSWLDGAPRKSAANQRSAAAPAAPSGRGGDSPPGPRPQSDRRRGPRR
jgi:hypothetical protein